jgi:hypothetical protein
MFARVKKSGKYEYLQIVHNERVGGKVRQRTIATLGRLDVLQAAGQVDGVVASLAKYTLHTSALSARRGQRPATSKRVGPVLLFERLWEELGMPAVLARLLEGRQFEFPVERAIFTTVLHRLFVSGSDRSAETWCRRYAIAGIESLDLHHLYRAMAWLGEALPQDAQAGATPFAPRCVKDLVEEELFARRRDLFTELEMVFFDTTSLYFEGEGGQSLGRWGKSKDHRPDLPQMVVGMVLDNTGRPLCCELWPGNTTDVTTLIPVVKRLRRRFGVRRVCIVADRGMISAGTIAELQSRAVDCRYILGARLRRVKEVNRDVLSRAGRYHVVRGPTQCSTDPSPLKVKQVLVEDRRYIVCYNEDQARKDRADREAIIAHLEQALRQGDKSLVGNNGYRRYLSTPGPDHFVIDRDKARAEARLDGKWVLRTDTDLSPAEVALKYKQLWMVEDLFRNLKSLVQTRPIYHQRDETIRGHVFCSFLALLLLKEFFDRLTAKGWTDVEWAPLKDDLDDVERFQLGCSGKTFEIRTDLPGDAGKAFRAVGVSPGPVIREVAQ